MGVTPLTAADFSELQPYSLGFETSSPLWYYVLKEAERVEDGLRLGPTHRGRGFHWAASDRPQVLPERPAGLQALVPTRTGRPEDFRMVDFLTFAGVDPTSRGQ